MLLILTGVLFVHDATTLANIFLKEIFLLATQKQRLPRSDKEVIKITLLARVKNIWRNMQVCCIMTDLETQTRRIEMV